LAALTDWNIARVHAGPLNHQILSLLLLLRRRRLLRLLVMEIEQRQGLLGGAQAG
jgi:hypothetical protein